MEIICFSSRIPLEERNCLQKTGTEFFQWLYAAGEEKAETSGSCETVEKLSLDTGIEWQFCQTCVRPEKGSRKLIIGAEK